MSPATDKTLQLLRSELGVAWFCYVFSTLTMVARLYSRIYRLRQFGLDDMLALAAVVLTTASAPMVHILHRDLSRCVALIAAAGSDPAALIQLLVALNLAPKLQYILSLLYPIALSLIKISILAFYRRFLPRKPYHVYLYVCAAGMAMLAVAVVLATAFQCDPVENAWNPLNFKCTRTNAAALSVVVNAFNLLTDLILLLLPVPAVLRLRVHRRKKIALLLLFSVGVIGTAVTALRLWKAIVILSIYGHVATGDRTIVAMMHVVLLSLIETALIIVCANMPAVAALFKRTDVGPSATAGALVRVGGSGGVGSDQKSAAAGAATAAIRAGGARRESWERDAEMGEVKGELGDKRDGGCAVFGPQVAVRLTVLERAPTRPERSVQRTALGHDASA